MVLKLWVATHWWVVKHSEVGREAFVRLVIKTPTGVPQHQFRQKSNARRAKEPFFLVSTSKIGRFVDVRRGEDLFFLFF